MAYFVYILKCRDGTFYAGSTNDVEKRLYAHNNLKSGAKYTRARRPVRVVYKQKFATAKRARQREYEIKQMDRLQKRELVGAGKKKERERKKKEKSEI
jgi:putative endonuclease